METNNYQEKWEAIRREMDAEADKLDAERRLKYNDAIENFSEEIDASKDWVEANWDQFTAKVKKWWNELQISMND